MSAGAEMSGMSLADALALRELPPAAQTAVAQLAAEAFHAGYVAGAEDYGPGARNADVERSADGAANSYRAGEVLPLLPEVSVWARAT